MATHGITAAFEPHTGYAGGAPERAAPATRQLGAMARLGRWIAMVVAVSAMALMLAGSMTESASARPRSMGTVADRCMDMGGDPTAYGFLGMSFTYCDWGDGTGVWGMD